MITTYSYDAAGNRTVLNEGGTRTTYAYDAGNRLRRSQEVAGITTFSFDNNGNQRRMLSPTGDITTYTWTFENQLRRIEDPDNALTTYTWAPVNRKGVELRIARETEDVLTNYLWDDQRLLMETDEVGAVEAEYTLQPQAYGPLVSQRRDSESSFYAFDALGSTAALTDDTQAITDEYAYKPFGELRSPSEAFAGTTENAYLWRGRHELYRDTDSGFYSLGRAQYGANLGRMVTQVGDGGDGNQYAQNEPIDGGIEVTPGFRIAGECIDEPAKHDKTDVIYLRDAMAAFPCLFADRRARYALHRPGLASDPHWGELAPPPTSGPFGQQGPGDPWSGIKSLCDANSVGPFEFDELPTDFTLDEWIRFFKSSVNGFSADFVLSNGWRLGDVLFGEMNELLSGGSADAQWELLTTLEEECQRRRRQEQLRLLLESPSGYVRLLDPNTALSWAWTIAGFFVPGPGEIDDARLACDTTASAGERTLACGSLLLSILLLGGGPNYGTLKRAGKELSEHFDEGLDSSTELERMRRRQPPPSVEAPAPPQRGTTDTPATREPVPNISPAAPTSVNIPTKGRHFNQIGSRGWTNQTIAETVQNPFTTRKSINRATGNPATVYYNSDGSYVVVDDVTRDLVQISDRTNITNWIPDCDIVDPFFPSNTQ